jgi:TetR/AcrR family transcriptional regulator, transcriptional repressor for nem operon
MPRPIEFERDKVLKSTMLQFWEDGYRATSMRDISACTGLQPGSLYLAFQDKQNLFSEALELYIYQRMEFLNAIFETDEPALVKFRNYFDLLVKSSLSKDGYRGCLMVNTILEIPVDNSDLRDRITKVFHDVELVFKKALDDAKHEGAISEDKDTRGLAKLIITTIHGIRVRSKTRPSKTTLNAIFNNLMSAIEQS